jgi:hypothetical protein
LSDEIRISADEIVPLTNLASAILDDGWMLLDGMGEKEGRWGANEA